jgi:hypothetical protein
MKLYLYTLYDNKAEAYLKPFFSQSNGAAIRSLTDTVNLNDGANMVSSHPEDYSLFVIGEWSEETGLLSPRESKGHLCDCYDLVYRGNKDVPSLIDEQSA